MQCIKKMPEKTQTLFKYFLNGYAFFSAFLAAQQPCFFSLLQEFFSFVEHSFLAASFGFSCALVFIETKNAANAIIETNFSS